jgi:class 3 adenylate cyclase/tetratricopeptide (TPR) repeat protein
MMTVVAWLEELGLAEYADVFAANGIDAALLPELNNEDLKDLGVARLADRKRLLKAIEELTPGSSTEGSKPSASVTPAGEHRQVTVLFADIAGFTRLTSELGAEEIHSLLNRYFEAVDAILLSYGGSVDKHIGDNVMAVFGAPIAHDDDPFRAVRAALDIHDRVRGVWDQRGRPLQVHIGIASGQVVASGTGSDNHREYTVTGESVNLAARLQDEAAAGETLISASVRRAIGDRVDCQDLGEIDVKGIQRPVRIWKVKVLGVADRPSTRVAFVGREAELAQLSGVVEACRASGSGRTIVMRGEAGIGKTRLVEEFTRIAVASGFKVHKGLVLDFGVGEGRDAIRSVVHSLLGIPAGSDRAMRQAAAESIIVKGLLAPEKRVFLNDLLYLPQSVEDHAIYDAMTNTSRNEGKRTTLAELLRTISAQQPLVIIIEDIHWADPLSLAHFARIAATVADCPGLLVMTSRVEGYPLDQAWRSTTGRCPFMTLDLGPLRREDSIKLAATFLDTTNQLALNCVQRADGNPLFLEQLLRNAEERGGGEVPASIQSLVLARIDRLPPIDKQALQAASVLGQRFALDALRHLIANPTYDCRGLIQRSLVRLEGDDDYLFDHALVQEGVYASLLKSRRVELHREAAAFCGERAPMLRAEHLDRAGDPAAAGAYLVAAGAQVATLHFETALRLAERGIELADEPAITADLCRLRGDALRNTGETDASIAAFEAALAVANDNKRKCLALIGIAEGLRIVDRQSNALVVLAEAEAAAIREDLVKERARIHYLRGNVYFPLGNIDGCLAEHEKALVFAREVNSAEGEALALGGLGDAYYLRGHMRTACEQFRACIRVCRDQDYRHIEVAYRHMIGWSRIHSMEFAEALDDGLNAAKLAAKVSNQRAEVLGLMLAGCVYCEFGQHEEAETYTRRSLELGLTIGSNNFAAQALRYLAQITAAQGRVGEALEHVERAVEIVRKVGMTFIGPGVLALKAALTEDQEEASVTFQEAESILDSGCVAHNHMWFAQTAIDHALANGTWDMAEHYAARLEDYTRGHPLAWPDFLIARARALAAWGRGTRSRQLVSELQRLRECAVQHGLVLATPGLDEALAAA